MMRYRRSLGRRTFLRGAGGVAIALPFLDEMRTRSVWAVPADPPTRAFNIFFSGSVPLPFQQAGLVGPLTPLLPFKDKMAFIRGIVGPDGHPASAGAAFVGKPAIDYVTAGGPSIDDEIMRHAYAPAGQTPTPLGPQAMGFFYSFLNQPFRWIKSWNQGGQANADLIDTPADLFTRLFGRPPGGPGLTQAEKVTASVLDNVVGQYRFYVSDRSNLSVESRSRLADHLETIRQLESRIVGSAPLGQGAGCAAPALPAATIYAAPHHDGAAKGPSVAAADFVSSFKVMADLWTMGVKCDLFRSGFTLALCAGDDLTCTGPYTVAGQVVDMSVAGDFHSANHAAGDNPIDLVGVMSGGLMHSGWYVHLLLECCARVLQQLDAVTEPNGKTILDNAFVVLGTDLGTNHSGRSVFHGVSKAGGKFKPGIYDVQGSLLEFLDSCKAAMGLGGAPTPGMSGFIA
jgi:Protein of unknown function (DUF1552)